MITYSIYLWDFSLALIKMIHYVYVLKHQKLNHVYWKHVFKTKPNPCITNKKLNTVYRVFQKVHPILAAIFTHMMKYFSDSFCIIWKVHGPISQIGVFLFKCCFINHKNLEGDTNHRIQSGPKKLVVHFSDAYIFDVAGFREKSATQLTRFDTINWTFLLLSK